MSTDLMKTGFDSATVQLIRDQLAKGASDAELNYFLAQCNRTKLDPFARQIFCVARWDTKLGRNAYTTQVSIDGMRLIAERTGKYEGQIGPLWCGMDGVWKDVWLEKGFPAAARVGVLRAGFREPIWSVAHWADYVQTKKDGNVNAMWSQFPTIMLSKCFDDKTEVLTEVGFRLFRDVTFEKIMQVTENGLEKVSAIPFSQSYLGEMVTFDSDDLNFSVTPNHDMVTTSGKITAGLMYDLSRARPSFFIPRLVGEAPTPRFPVSDEQIEIAAAYMADGFSITMASFKIRVSRDRKVSRLDELGYFRNRSVVSREGAEATMKGGRIVVSTKDQVCFSYDFAVIRALVTPGKRIQLDVIEKLSSAQCRLFVDSWAFYDGNTGSGGGLDRTLRIYTADENHADMIDLFAVKGGYAVSRNFRESEEGKPQIVISLSERDEIPVARWGRFYRATKEHTSSRKQRSLEVTTNKSGVVWCVTVPSHVIVVRRNGFSMLCGNCAEALSLRRSFPQDLSGCYAQEEMPDTIDIPHNHATPVAPLPELPPGPPTIDTRNPEHAKIITTLLDSSAVTLEWRTVNSRALAAHLRGKPLCDIAELIQHFITTTEVK